MSDPRGRILLGRIPEGWEESGDPQFNARGEKFYARLLKNMPGRLQAGRGLEEGIVDRRVFYKLTPGPLPRRLALVVGVHVDDNLSLVLDKQTYNEFRTQWSGVFKSSQTAKHPTNIAFAGLGFAGRYLIGHIAPIFPALNDTGNGARRQALWVDLVDIRQ